jgi:hypothetical protein
LKLLATRTKKGHKNIMDIITANIVSKNLCRGTRRLRNILPVF